MTAHTDSPAPAAPQELVEQALAASTADDCLVVVRDRTSANLRWANNTLTTNGVMSGVDVTVVSFARSGAGSAAASAAVAGRIPSLVIRDTVTIRSALT